MKQFLAIDFLKGIGLRLRIFSLVVFPPEEVYKLYHALLAVLPIETVFEYDGVIRGMELSLLRFILESMPNDALKKVCM
jgi:hypothetical protein